MRAKTNKINITGCFINPYQQKIALHMAFHTTGIISG